ncbi:MAG: nucleotidyltransferase domain-containing protein [bacterium]|nr:nucleotidyltransferase domain-containing protein [bacterium]
MPRFQTFLACSASLALADVLGRLERHERVIGAALLGSTAGNVAPWSDFDILVATADGPAFDVEFTYVEHRPTDVIFMNRAEIRRLSAKGATSKKDADLLRWLGTGRSVFSKSADFQALADTAADAPPASGPADSEIFFRWVEANFTLVKTRRWLGASGSSYRLALEFLLLGALSAVLADYLACRGHPWQGEKTAVEWLEQEDPDFLEALAAASRETSPEHKVRHYERLVTHAFSPVGQLWGPDETSGGWIRADGEARERSLWEELIQFETNPP